MADIIFPDVANAFAKVQAIQSNALRERLMLTQANREEEAYQRDTRARQLYPAAIGGDAAAAKQLAGISPELYGTLMKAKKEGREQQLAEFNQRAQLIGQAAASVLAVPPEQRASVYAAQRTRLLSSGLVTPDQVPEQYNEGVVTAAARNAQSIDAVMKQLSELPQVMTPAGARPVSQMGPQASASAPPSPAQPAPSPALQPSQGAAPQTALPPMPEPEAVPPPASPPPDRAAVQAQAQFAARGVNPQGLSPAEEARAVSDAARSAARGAIGQRASAPPPMPVGTAIAAAGSAADMPATEAQPAQFSPPGQPAQGPYPVMKQGLPVTKDMPPGYQLGWNPATGGYVAMPMPGAETTEQKAAAEERGRARGKVEGANAPNPAAAQKADEALRIIEKTKTHPGRSWGTGVTGIVPGIPGMQQRDFVALVDQIKGKAFLEAFESLKGGGQITEIEGQKATAAIARLDRAQTEAGFLEALRDLEYVVKVGRARARGETPPPAPPATTAPSSPSPEIDALLKKYGGGA